jgi:hypothetical protein
MCSLEEAFSTEDTRAIEPEDRRRKKKRKMLLPPPEPNVIEPDRPAHRPLPPAELLGGSPESNTHSSSESAMLNAYDVDDYFPHPAPEVKEDNVYQLGPDWTKQFDVNSLPEWLKDRFPDRDAEVPLTPSPWLDGASTLWRRVGSEMKKPELTAAKEAADSRLDDLQRKLDSMFDRLQEIDNQRAESNHLEIILFVLGGVFLLLLLDLLVKQGTRASVMLASAAGSMSGGFRGFRIR